MSDLKLESNDIELLWCQFTALAATRWPKDPNQLGWAIDRTAFNRTFIPQFGSFTTPNLIHDRIFAHYDSNRDGLIGFQEFVSGLENMQERDLDKRLPVVFNGYDVDNDGYICRKDCLRMLRAHYDIEKAATRDYVNDASRDPTLNKRTNIIQSRQPLASAFSYSPTSTRSLNPYRPSDKPAGDFENMPQIMNNDSVDAIDPDVGNESLYQITQDGFNELLDPIFREREEIAQEATSTLAERKQRDRLPIHFGEHVHFNVAACRYGAFNYIRAVITELSMARMPSLFETKEKLRAYYEELLHLAETRVSSACPSFADQSGVSHHQLWRTQLIRQKFRQEWLDAMEEIGADRIQDMETTVEAQSGPNAGIPEKDPTWPQSRQNSDQSLTLPCAGVTPAKASNGSAVQETKILVASCDGMPPEAHPLDGDALEDHVIYYVSKPLPSHNDRPFIAWKLSTLISSAGNHAERSEEYLGSLIRLEASDPSSTLHDILLAYHDWVDRETAERGGPGRINLEELMELQKRDSDLRFLECWLTSWGNF
jgi:Ca2+-binding EF-hand superfamily protein